MDEIKKELNSKYGLEQHCESLDDWHSDSIQKLLGWMYSCRKPYPLIWRLFKLYDDYNLTLDNIDKAKKCNKQIHPIILHSFHTWAYRLVFAGSCIQYTSNIENMGCGYSELWNCSTEQTKDHFNPPQPVFSIVINEYIVEDVYYGSEDFFHLYYECHKVRNVATKENTQLKTNQNLGVPFDLLYENNTTSPIKIFNRVGDVIDNKATFPEYLLGDIDNRNKTWEFIKLDE